mmetsp:Transcript_66807/g.132422  ORF Transcript_66807/g.132422 Transcript_66807/m.132422 type:complete len:246 (-) Transcript_66807:154-891(-)
MAAMPADRHAQACILLLRLTMCARLCILSRCWLSTWPNRRPPCSLPRTPPPAPPLMLPPTPTTARSTQPQLPAPLKPPRRCPPPLVPPALSWRLTSGPSLKRTSTACPRACRWSCPSTAGDGAHVSLPCGHCACGSPMSTASGAMQTSHARPLWGSCVPRRPRLWACLSAKCVLSCRGCRRRGPWQGRHLDLTSRMSSQRSKSISSDRGRSCMSSSAADTLSVISHMSAICTLSYTNREATPAPQ